MHIPDVLSDPDYAYAGPRPHRSAVSVPILLDAELIGTVAIVRTEPQPFADEHIELVLTFADQAAIAIANARLLDRVERQRGELARFVSPQVAELLSSEDGERLLAGHLRDYHALVGELIARHDGTLEHFAGDGVMVFFNDPAPVADHEAKAIRMSLALQDRFGQLADVWRKRGTELGLGIGIAAGYATLGRIGFEGRYEYGVLGPVTSLASRLSTRAEAGQTLISQRVFAAVEDAVGAQPVGELELKGFGRPVAAYEVSALRAS